jgi:predicted N-formylglutamate amidohydrolase
MSGEGGRRVAAGSAILSGEDGLPVETVNPDGRADVVLICEHAANRIPGALDGLGIDADTRRSHVAWDPGAAEVARAMAVRLDAPLFLQRFSRLVYDCNRPVFAESAVPAVSERYTIPGNDGLDRAARARRQAAIYLPFRDTVAAFVRARLAAGRPPMIVTVHTFTPVFQGRRRTTELGVLHDADARLADAVLALLTAEDGLEVRRNDPYGPEDGVTHTLKVQALGHGLPNVMFEIRSDLVADAAGQRAFAERLSRTLTAAWDLLQQWFGPGADMPPEAGDRRGSDARGAGARPA